MKPSPIYQYYIQIAPKLQDWATLVTKTGELISRDYDWSDELGKITAQTMLVFGDADSISPAYAAKFYELLGGGKHDAGWDGSGKPRNRLAILPGTIHYNILDSPLITPIASAFLDEPLPNNR